MLITSYWAEGSLTCHYVWHGYQATHTEHGTLESSFICYNKSDFHLSTHTSAKDRRIQSRKCNKETLDC